MQERLLLETNLRMALVEFFKGLLSITLFYTFLFVLWNIAYDYGRESVSCKKNYDFERVPTAFIGKK